MVRVSLQLLILLTFITTRVMGSIMTQTQSIDQLSVNRPSALPPRSIPKGKSSLDMRDPTMQDIKPDHAPSMPINDL